MVFGFVNKENMSLLTDLYELTMAQVYFKKGMNKTAIFDFYTRPVENRSYLVNAGLEQLIYYLENVRFTQEDIDYLRTTGFFEEDFLSYLKDFKFTGNLYAVEEGEFIFPNEPVVQVEAPIIEAQIIETFLINTLQHPILVATKAMRCYSVARGTVLVDFGLRRAHGTDAGMKAARASFIGGFAGTSNVLAGKEYGIPIFGTMAHSFILAHIDEIKAFKDFAEIYPENSILLVDTFDSIKGVYNAVKAIKELGMKHFKGIRLDSGDLLKLSKEARKILDSEGFKDAKIIASGGINEYKIKELLDKGAPIDGWGVGTELVVSADLPYLDCAYKLVEYDGRPVMKFSSKKKTLPHKKQIFRIYEDGVFKKDIITRFDEDIEKGKPLLKKVIENGKVVYKLPKLTEIQKKAIENFSKLPEELKDITKTVHLYPEVSSSIQKTVKELERKYLNGELQ
ncbi:nicotinate phosphoribosyltransferase [Persephonella hydrogeniphila]|uniref:Nicotinate phosphoribosyltransferase n=1 Tax=Persephonella hydrogeniphila TaxID=198703 RepID=A0A285MYE9_9AQUI|nr:nicotinate phosphoribosyltransferase [Persephonella hydrogeniphila]SNZ02215.1 nicotinate phosphoribosyltransferase [Persephonella hydrogeniphila]